VAEKVHAICLLGMANTRMKDYFDLRVLLDDSTLDPAEIRRATVATFERRKMPLPSAVPVGLEDLFAEDATKQTQWNAFLKKNCLPAITLAEVVRRSRSKLHEAGVLTVLSA